MAASALDALAALAEPYARLLRGADALTLREAEPSRERRLQAYWQSAAVRDLPLALPDGTPLRVLDPGHWNAVEGPDFRDALILFGEIPRRGDVELHLRPADWDAHRHAGDPAYAGLILHVAWSPDPPAKTLPRGVPTLALRPFAEAAGAIDFAALDPAATAPERPCHGRLGADPVARDRLLAAAGHYRLLAKTRLFAQALGDGDPLQAFYEALFAAMGYRRNAAPFRRLAHDVPFAVVSPFPSLQRYAALAGIGGLLREDCRDLWDLWWRTGLPPATEPYAWDFRAMRPQNHPRRRLAGAIGILHDLAALLECPLGELPRALIQASKRLCEPLGLRGAPIGANRAHAVVTNLFTPYRLAIGTLDPARLRDLPGEDLSAPMRAAWFRLTGQLGHLPKDGLRQQGLLQIHADFCANPALLCATCPIAAL